MKRTFQLFQLLIVVFGFYAAMKFSGNAKSIVSLSAIVVVIILDRMESFLDITNSKLLAAKQGKQGAEKKTDQSEKNLKVLLNSKNHPMLVDAVQALLRDIGLTVGPCRDHSFVDRVIKIEDQGMLIGVKVVNDLATLVADWENLGMAEGFIDGEDGRMRLLLVHPAGEQSQNPDQQSEKVPAHILKFITERHTIAVTTKTMARIYHLCKDMNQDSKRIFGRIYHHPGGFYQM